MCGMKKIKLNTCAFVMRVVEHERFKDYMLNYIKNQPTNRLIEGLDDITNTDWNDSHDGSRKYVKKFGNIIQPYLTKMGEELRTSVFKISDIWYQQYSKYSKHQWHYHGGANWSAIYYIELPDTSIKTELFDIPENKIINSIEINEGDLFLFPANILHRAPPNKTDEVKTIISFNVDFDGVTQVFKSNDKKYVVAEKK